MKLRTIALFSFALLVVIAGIAQWRLIETRQAQTPQIAAPVAKTVTESTAPTTQGDEIASIQDLIDGEYHFTPVDTSTWKIYRNDEMGFEVKIPKDWEVKDSYNDASIKGMGIGFGEKGKTYPFEGAEETTAIFLGFSDRYNVKAVPLRDFINQHKSGYAEEVRTFSINGLQWLLIGNMNALTYDKDREWSASFAAHSDKVPRMEMAEYSVFLGILQTFKFTK